MEVHYLGNKELLKLPKTAFLASSTIPLDMVLKCFDWAAGKHEEEECIISGFSSKLENDVLHFLIKAKCPVILVLARRMLKVFPDELKVALSEGRLLIISTCNAVRQSKTTALSRNKYICELADSILFIGVTEKSSLYSLEQTFKTKKQEIDNLV